MISGYHQLISSTTHMANRSFCCIDLILTSNPSFNTEYGIKKSLYADSCHHGIVFGKMNLKVPLFPLYACELLDYKS